MAAMASDVEALKANWNAKTPSVRRILQEVKELTSRAEEQLARQRGASTSTGGGGDAGEGVAIVAEALEENIFEWHFAIGGQVGSEYEGGVYHGRILLPAEYPFKPPDFVMLTPSGRFEVGKRICLSISRHHPEHWQPSWSVRTALTALIAFMPTPGEGALGSLNYTEREKRDLALGSRVRAPKFGNANRQEVSDRIHAKMLELVAPRKGELETGAAAAEDGEPEKVEDDKPEKASKESAAEASGDVENEEGTRRKESLDESARAGLEAVVEFRRRERERAAAEEERRHGLGRRRGGVGDLILSTVFWVLLALATCAILKNVAKSSQAYL